MQPRKSLFILSVIGFLLLITFMFIQKAEAVTMPWNTFMGSAGGDDHSYDIAADGSGNVYVTGGSEATWGSPVQGFAGDFDAFAAKFDSSGSLVWNTFMGSAGSYAGGHGIAVDGAGNVYVTGSSSATWGSPIVPWAGEMDNAFVAKLDSSGTRLWNTFSNVSGCIVSQARDIAVDGSGNIYVTGRACPFLYGECKAFVQKLDSSGTSLWVKVARNCGRYDIGNGIAVDGAGNIYVTGEDCDSPGFGSCAFVQKLDSSGNSLWIWDFGCSSTDSAAGSGIAADGSGSVYMLGSSSTYGVFMQKFGSSGNLLWNTFLGSNDGDTGAGIAIDGSGNAYVSGYGDATWGSPIHPYAGLIDSFVAKFDSSGNRLWNTFMGSASSRDYSIGIAADGSGNVYVMGYSDATWGSPIHPYTGLKDAFVAKLYDDGLVPTTTTTTTIPASSTTTTTTIRGGPCPARKVLGDATSNLESLSAFRDKKLAHSALGRKAIQIYYGNAGSINAVLDSSPALREVVRMALEKIAQMAARKEE